MPSPRGAPLSSSSLPAPPPPLLRISSSSSYSLSFYYLARLVLPIFFLLLLSCLLPRFFAIMPFFFSFSFSSSYALSSNSLLLSFLRPSFSRASSSTSSFPSILWPRFDGRVIAAGPCGLHLKLICPRNQEAICRFSPPLQLLGLRLNIASH